MEAHHTGNPSTYLEVKGQGHKVPYAGLGITVFLKLACLSLYYAWIQQFTIQTCVGYDNASQTQLTEPLTQI